jgi:hypothetical protein
MPTPRRKTPRPGAATALHDQVQRDPALQERLKQDPVGALADLAAKEEPAEPEGGRARVPADTWMYRLAVAALSVIAFTGLLMIFLIRFVKGVAAPDSFIAIVSGAVGAIAALLPTQAARGS